MKSKLIWSIVTAWALTMAGFAVAQTGTATPPEVTPPSSTPGVGTGSENKGLNTAETKAGDHAKPELEAIRTRARMLSAKQIEATEPKVDAEIKNVNTEASKEGSKVPDRLAKQLGMTSDALAAEKAQFNAGFGELMIAHLLLSNEKSTSTVTLADLFKMHEDGTGWGQIAHGMGLKLGDLVSAAKSEGRVATGKGKVDTKTPRIGPEGQHGAMASKGAAGTMEHGQSATTPSHEMGGASAAGHGK
ncbi:MAG: hypothetical protein E6K76_11655 [Candidatus Eisenbacteria bacterium]|uniref:Uncharacterized protein n=1 Tax=Eiseniibacteriota bacterium TaxID=2212470 RepID=A0A538T0A9_UNCEI|nr:MAG: hypothetical protein E6K76_11655 [Candidatus Eisenbacteria bacterium]